MGLFYLGWICECHRLDYSDIQNNIDPRIKTCSEKIRKMLCLKVVTFRQMDCFVCYKIIEIIENNKNIHVS